jgi:hypothetical protein
MPPLHATTPPSGGHSLYEWKRLASRQREAVRQLLRTDQARRRAQRQRLEVLLIILAVLLLAVLGVLLFLLLAGGA